MLLKRLAQLLVLGTSIGCAADSRDLVASAAESDSAGIIIVENSGPTWVPGSEWRVDYIPLQQIGVADGPDAYAFSNVAGATRFSDGSIAVVDGGSHEIRYFTADGRHLTTMGRTGSGPGEFTAMSGVVSVPGDSILVVDPANRRITIVHPASQSLRSASLPVDWMIARPVGLVSSRFLALVDASPTGPYPPARDTRDLAVLNLADGASRVIAQLPFAPEQSIPGIGATQVVAASPLAGIWLGSGPSYSLALHDSTGALKRVARIAHSPVRVSDEVIAEWKRMTPAGAQPEFPEFLPPLAHAIVDREGNLWVRPYSTDSRAIWNVIDPEGRYLGDVELPDGFIPFEIGSDFVLSPAWDEYQVEYVRLYRLLKPA